MDYSGKLMLATLNVSKWYARTFDARATREVATNHGADVGRFNKRLLPKDCSLYDAVTRAEGQARKAFNALTLAYSPMGLRLLPTAAYFDCTTAVNAAQAQFDAAVAAFMAAYEGPDGNEIMEAARPGLNGLFSAADYPPAKEVKAAFKLRVSFLPFADAAELGVELPDDKIAAIKMSIAADVREATASARKELRDRLLTAVTHMAERLTASQNGGRLHDSAITGVREMAEILPKLNFAQDPVIDAAVARVQALCRYDVNSLRASSSARLRAAHEASAAVRDVTAMFAIDIGTLGGAFDAAAEGVLFASQDTTVVGATPVEIDQYDLLAAFA